MAIVGAFARIDSPGFVSCVEHLDALPGVSTFDIDDPNKIGLIIEADSLEQAHDIITQTIRSTIGVLGVWPVYANIEDEIQSIQRASSASGELADAHAS